MKITSKPSDHQNDYRAEDRNRTSDDTAARASSSSALNAGDKSGARSSSTESGRSFAAVLNELAHQREARGDDGGGEGRDEHGGGGSGESNLFSDSGDITSTTRRTGRAEEAGEQREKDGGDGGGSGDGQERGGGNRNPALYGQIVMPGVNQGVASAGGKQEQMLLQIAELERIVAAVRTQIFAGGRREITLDLHRSVLEGLRIKIKADKEGNLSAEFLSNSERVQRELDERKDELAEAFRARGIGLSSIVSRLEQGGREKNGGDERDREDETKQDAISAARKTR